MTSVARSRFPEFRAGRKLLVHPRYVLAYIVSVPLVALTYALLLEWISLGVVGMSMLRFLTLSQVVLVIGFAVLFPWVILLDIYLWKHPVCAIDGKELRTGDTTLAGALLGFLPNALCCTPIIPSLLALFISGGTLVEASAPIQHAINVYEPVLFGISLITLWFSIRLASRRLEWELRAPQVENGTSTVPE